MMTLTRSVKRVPVIITALTLSLTTGCQSSTPSAPLTVVPPTSAVSLLPAVRAIPPYHRSEFGPGWDRVYGHCNTRAVILKRDAGANARDNGNGCDDSGPIVDPYSGNTITPQRAQIDHVFPLGKAWPAGAYAWTPLTREIFYNDQANLLAVTGSLNESKGDRGPADWKPPNHAFWCGYARVYQATAQRWKLTVDQTDQAAIQQMETTCPK